MTKEHTPTPWRITLDTEDMNGVTRQQIGTKNETVAYTFGMSEDDEAKLRRRANADHIVKCVNLFDELVEVVFNGTEVLTLEDHIQWRHEALALLSKTKSPAYNRALSEVAKMDVEGES